MNDELPPLNERMRDREHWCDCSNCGGKLTMYVAIKFEECKVCGHIDSY